MLDFNKLIEKHLTTEWKPKDIGRYYPSEIGGCLRKVYYSYIDPKPVKMDLTKIFEVGNILHDFIAEVLRSEKNPEVELIDSELPFKLQLKDFIISGRVDDLLLIRTSGKEALVEVKSVQFLKYIDSPQSPHLMQIQLYMHALGIREGYLLYIEKATLDTKAFHVKYDAEEAMKAIDRFKMLHKFLKEKKLPEPEARTSRKAEIAWMCDKCDWREECFKR
ncbi:MAG: Dna2/Cas4 domain-containing protein [Candidatus Aenigmatarchaeota archaeon]|nr:Dna2/Cas4 domain-containing protein [Candidatus Aenigmarchaeota archaeon]